MRLLAPDDAADLIQSFPEEKRPAVLRLLYGRLSPEHTPAAA